MKLYDGGFLFLLSIFIFSYGISVLERSADEMGIVTTVTAKEVIDGDIDYVIEKSSKAWASRQPLDYSKMN